jgi:hypothetical protein
MGSVARRRAGLYGQDGGRVSALAVTLAYQRRPRWRRGRARNRLRTRPNGSGHRPSSARPSVEKGGHEACAVEDLQIIDALTDADILYGNPELVRNANHNAPFRRAIEFG